MCYLTVKWVYECAPIGNEVCKIPTPLILSRYAWIYGGKHVVNFNKEEHSTEKLHNGRLGHYLCFFQIHFVLKILYIHLLISEESLLVVKCKFYENASS